jgi:hypothetical protein
MQLKALLSQSILKVLLPAAGALFLLVGLATPATHADAR